MSMVSQCTDPCEKKNVINTPYWLYSILFNLTRLHPLLVFKGNALPPSIIPFLFSDWRICPLSFISTDGYAEIFQQDFPAGRGRQKFRPVGSLAVFTTATKPIPSDWDSSGGVRKGDWPLFYVQSGQFFPFCNVYWTGTCFVPPLRCMQ